MKLNISIKEIGDVYVVALKGRILLGEESNSLSERIKSLICEGKKIVLNMANVTYIRQHRVGDTGGRSRQRPETRHRVVPL